MRDRFANYVVQRLLDVAAPHQKEEVFWILKDQVARAPRSEDVGAGIRESVADVKGGGMCIPLYVLFFV